MAEDRPLKPQGHAQPYDPQNEIFIHMPATAWIDQQDPPEFDESLLASLEQKRQELDAKVHRYIAKKQGQFNDWVGDKRSRYELRAEERRHRHDDQDAPPYPSEPTTDDDTSPPKTPEDQNARRRAEDTSQDVAKQESPDDPASATREKDSELLQLLPGFLPLLDEQEGSSSSPARSSSAPPSNGRAEASPPTTPINPRIEFGRSVTAPSPIYAAAARSARRPLPRRSSLKQPSSGNGTGSRKAVRLSLGPQIVTPTQSPPEHDEIYDPVRLAEEQRLLEEQALAIIEQETEEKWRTEPERTYIDFVPTEPASVPNVDGPADVPSPRLTPPASPKPEAKEPVEAGSATPELPGPMRPESPSECSTTSYGETSAEQALSLHGNEAPNSPATKPVDKEKKKKKRRKSKSSKSAGPHAALSHFTPTPATVTTAVSSAAPEAPPYSPVNPVAAPYEDIPEPVYQHVSPSRAADDPNTYSGSLLSSSMRDSGPHYGTTRSRPPPSSLRPDMASLNAVNVPLPVGGFSAGSATGNTPRSYGSSAMPRASLGESYMALHFARRMMEREMERNRSGDKTMGRQQHHHQPELGRALSEVGEGEEDDVGVERNEFVPSGAVAIENDNAPRYVEDVDLELDLNTSNGPDDGKKGEDEDDQEFMGDLDL
ncbi:uncharacterized protein K452DRAFT_152999 [Aplosporella prunicola CBS 121167]|uniref:Uncharacterized protein n=1 Tax=Aplosporella prunicola CBS 121167 TaxID=1176127 RepID=A0A6A6BIY1_9PEZI|nr:uncharacterized protein K452DRAFT_152999 [Aplosporella prunicola CBS 121167]KAF2144100.1 hypothetical protein K452DRAFT_152999 [Aplosporella prunicola CBS 121167]